MGSIERNTDNFSAIRQKLLALLRPFGLKSLSL